MSALTTRHAEAIDNRLALIASNRNPKSLTPQQRTQLAHARQTIEYAEHSADEMCRKYFTGIANRDLPYECEKCKGLPHGCSSYRELTHNQKSLLLY